jgi:hypothetical protein
MREFLLDNVPSVTCFLHLFSPGEGDTVPAPAKETETAAGGNALSEAVRLIRG